MHLKSYPKLLRSELRLEMSPCSSLFVRTCSSNHGNNHIISRLPLGIISTNKLRPKALPSAASQPRSPSPVCEDNALRLHQTAVEDADAPLDVWTVIRPGHVREKIAIFASDAERTDDGASSERTSTGDSDGTPSVCPNHGAVSGLSRAGKAKGSWEENCSAKRRRRSGSNQNLQKDSRTRIQDAQRPSPRHSGGELVTEEQTLSVVEMVAFLEQRASEQQPDSKPVVALQRSSTTITLSRAPPPEVRGEEPESIRVSDMVAKLESECLKRTEGDLSRSNSLRTVARVLLTAGDQSPAPCRPSSPSLPVAQILGREPTSYSEPALTTPPSGEAQGAEPLPGLLFLSWPPASQPHPTPARCDSVSQSEVRRRRRRRRRRRADRADRAQEDEVIVPLVRRVSHEDEVIVPLVRRVSHDFLLMRWRLQQLLEPRPFLSALPHHLLLNILTLLPTLSLAALKCSCRFFLSVIEDYGVRPSDSLWVSDPRYRDDPCKQCKRRFVRGDVSLCRWHHKPFCRALPYGLWYWMCCHAARRDAPGCNVGLHDNRWVPAFHSIDVYRRGRHDD
ncbi:F-box only protein 34 isoform X3 [Anarrhichthys ocellatus]|uniref:F-box only protein 34 isoform X2 n=1 Tax=Anarrhichthys ocellatus TaxID=433405 RepID=UPI0012EEA4D7|nr:F-box only protein 34 isoform X2 [Anarrhichthys ocellatus]XP_031735252.1 F-box only protein 34 isoform X3 [Anarrhichthys ocellatus]